MPRINHLWTDREKAEMIVLYRSGLSLRQVAEQFETEASVVRSILRRHDEPIRSQKEGIGLWAQRSRDAVKKIVAEMDGGRSK